MINDVLLNNQGKRSIKYAAFIMTVVYVSFLLLKRIFLLFYFKKHINAFCYTCMNKYEHILNKYGSVFIDNISHQMQMVVDKYVGVMNVIYLNDCIQDD